MVWHKNQVRATPAELSWMALVSQLPCCICAHPMARQQTSPTQVHHIVRSKRLGHFWVLPVCEDHHRRIGKYRHCEQKLWTQLNVRMGITDRSWPESKVIARRA